MNDFNLEKALDDYFNASARIFKHFECEYTWLEICDHSDSYWNEDGNCVSWTEIDSFEKEHYEFMYYSVLYKKALYPKGEHIMILADPQLGDGPQALIFKLSNRKNIECYY